MGKTEEHLRAAFAGESQARNKYTYFAQVARKEGYHYIARIFEETAENERRHAKDEFALLNKEDCLPGYLSLIPEGYKSDNRAPAAISILLSAYRPISRAPGIGCPVLMIAAEQDSLIPFKGVERCASKIPRVKMVSLPVGHFDVYTGEWFARVSAMEAEFLVEQLL